MKLRIALLQMHVEMGNPSVNFAHAKELMEMAMEKKPDILVLPESFLPWPMRTGRKPLPFSLP